DECLDVIIESAHSRFPVISEDKDHIEGILMAKDLLPFMRSDAGKAAVDRLTAYLPRSRLLYLAPLTLGIGVVALVVLIRHPLMP
ncbi:hypothetical protein MJM43_28465, partial [Salmonella enterica subsp. enterica serovar Montevideo]|nr:hypothetical protein [Salmonella enterica subsp. enterica serovar Montevideo]